MKLLLLCVFFFAVNFTTSAAITSAEPMAKLKLPPEEEGAIPFEMDRAELGPKANAKIKQYGKLFSDPRMKSMTITIQGHAGLTEKNPKELSLKRAQAVADALKQRYELKVAQIQVVGLGVSKASATMTDNQRVVIVGSKK